RFGARHTRPEGSRIAVGIRRAIASFQPHLMRAMSAGPIDEEILVERDAAFGLGIELDHPAAKPIRIELLVDDSIERVGEIDPFAIAADLDHLWPAIERLGLGRRMRGARND